MRLTLQTIVEKRQRRARQRAETPSFPLALPEGEIDVPRGCPTPEEIRERCLVIQAEWSEAERRKRGAWSVKRWNVPGADRFQESKAIDCGEVYAALAKVRRSMKSPGQLLNEGIHRMAKKLSIEFGVWRW